MKVKNVEKVDYHNFTHLNMGIDERRKLNVGDLWINAAICHNCGDYVRSCNRHDFVRCSCGKLAVDGGSMYAKRVAEPGTYTNDIVPFTFVDEGSYL